MVFQDTLSWGGHLDQVLRTIVATVDVDPVQGAGTGYSWFLASRSMMYNWLMFTGIIGVGRVHQSIEYQQRLTHNISVTATGGVTVVTVTVVTVNVNVGGVGVEVGAKRGRKFWIFLNMTIHSRERSPRPERRQKKARYYIFVNQANLLIPPS